MIIFAAGSTKVKISANNEQGTSSDFVDRRRASLERYLVRTAAHPVFNIDPDFREFLEAGNHFGGNSGSFTIALVIMLVVANGGVVTIVLLIVHV